MNHVVMFSSGVPSAVAAKRVAERYGTATLTLLFCDVLGEDEDNYRFLADAAQWVGGTLVVVADGRDIWQVFRDRRMLGNSRIAPCSVTLKQQVARRWLQQHHDPGAATLYLGYDWTEWHRLQKARTAWAPYCVEAPLCEKPYLDKRDCFAMIAAAGLTRPRLYDLGFRHANCGGLCVRAGRAAFLHALRVLPERYALWEQREADTAAALGRPVSILPAMTLRELRERFEQQPAQSDLFGDDWGGCGCFAQQEFAL